jgi:parallel beta-helix repeat protein
MIKLLSSILFLLLSSSLLSQMDLQKTKSLSPLSFSDSSSFVICNLKIRNDSGICVSLKNCRNIKIYNCDLGPSIKEGIHIEDCEDIVIENCFFSNNSSCIYVIRSTKIQIRGNQFLNVHGPYPRGQFVQFNSVFGSDNIIENNKGENLQKLSQPEDLINIYKSSGTYNSPIIIRNNKFRGSGTSKTGGGIVAGDSGGSYMTIENNILVDPGQYGIGVAGGNVISVRNNKIFARKQFFTNVGITVWNQNKLSCDSIEVSYNRVNYTNRNGVKNPAWNASNCGIIKGWDTNVWNDNIDSSILPKKLINISDKEISRIRKQAEKYIANSDEE